MKRLIFLYLMIFLPGFLEAKVNVVVSIVPQKTFVKKIAGNLADVTVMVVPGASPETYEPKASQMAKLSKADIYFSIGVPFEKAWLPKFKAQNRRMKVVDTTKGIKKVPMASYYDKKYLSSSLDPHIWLSPSRVKIMATTIAASLSAIDPKNASIYASNLATFKHDIDNLNKKLHTILLPCKGKNMMVFHPSWGYFSSDFGLHQIPIEIEGKAPKAKMLVKLIKNAKEKNIKALFVQPQFSKRSADIIAKDIGAKSVNADPLRADWSENLISIARQICKAYK